MNRVCINGVVEPTCHVSPCIPLSPGEKEKRRKSDVLTHTAATGTRIARSFCPEEIANVENLEIAEVPRYGGTCGAGDRESVESSKRIARRLVISPRDLPYRRVGRKSKTMRKEEGSRGVEGEREKKQRDENVAENDKQRRRRRWKGRG